MDSLKINVSEKIPHMVNFGKGHYMTVLGSTLQIQTLADILKMSEKIVYANDDGIQVLKDKEGE